MVAALHSEGVRLGHVRGIVALGQSSTAHSTSRTAMPNDPYVTNALNGPGAQNLAVVRRAALAVLKADTSFKASMPRRVRQAGHDDAYRTHLLFSVIS